METLFRLKLTCEPCTKPLPFTVRVNAGPPAVALEGEMLLIAGCAVGAVIVSVTVLEVPPPGTPFVGVVTVILAVPWDAICAGVISEVINDGLANDVAWGMPLKLTTELVTKFEPFTNRAKGGAAAAMLEGLIAEMVGESAATGNSTEVEAPPPGSGLNTKTTAVPSLSTSLAKILAFICVELTNVVLRACPPKNTVDPGTKFAPFTCKVKAVSFAIAKDGESDEIMGTGFIAVSGPREIAKPPATLSAVSFHGDQDSGVRTPVEAAMENPRTCANPAVADAYLVELEKANFPVGSTTMDVGLIPAAKGEPGICVSAPVPGLIAKAEMLPSYWLGLRLGWKNWFSFTI